MPGLIDTAANMVDVRSGAADSSSEFLLLGVIHFDDISVDRHLSEICAHVACTKLRHLAFYEFLFLFGDAEFNSYWSCSVCHKNTPFNLQRTFQMENLAPFHFTTDNFWLKRRYQRK